MSRKVQNEYNCESCLYKCSNKRDFNKHLLTKKHLKNVENGINPKINSHIKYTCELCDYRCSNERDFNKHLLTKKHATNTEISINPGKILPKKNPLYTHSGGYKCTNCNYSCKYERDYNKHMSTNKHQRIAGNSGSDDNSIEEVKNMVIACMQTQGFLQTMVTTLAENQTNQQELQKKQLELQNVQMEFQKDGQRNQQEFQNKFLEVLPTLGTTNIQTQNQNNTFNLTTYLTIDCKDAETFNETKLRLKDYILGLDTNAFIEHAANSSSNAIMEKVIRGFYSNIEPCKRSIQTVDVARGKSYVKHDENGFILDDEGNAVNKIACAAAHHSVNHCLRYKNTMKNPDNTWKSDSIGSDYENVDNKVNNMWRFTDANETMAKKVVGNATKIDKVKV
jgi:hypothetical protein